ncbi:MAG: hypothetical protein MZV70_04985 [Desulfobacterales bacterium]|nr:hypothetical protein [Desulfobacterales bacterium]
MRPQEYATLEAVAYDHLELGKVVGHRCAAPAGTERSGVGGRVFGRNAQARAASLMAVWVIVSPDTARRRMLARGEARDALEARPLGGVPAAAALRPARGRRRS